MAFWNIFTFFLLIYMFPVTDGIPIQVNNGGYEDLVIAIHPKLQENVEIIEKIKEMVTDASSYLYNATRKRLYINTVKILIPSSWTVKEDYEKPQRETYRKANVLIADPISEYGDTPYTFHHGQCGDQGEYIHFTPNFLLNISLTEVYGNPGRVFVHEWAHLRWGVFDEYSIATPYYVSRDLNIEATGCSASLAGANVLQKCEEDSCSVSTCSTDPVTGLYEEGCLFLPEKEQQVPQSIMYLTAIPSISEFCDESNHNIEAPNLQNKLCNLRSTWNVIQNSADIQSSPPMSDFDIPAPTFSLLQYRSRVITIACDISDSMKSFGRIGRLYQAAEFFLNQVIETGSHVGIVEFAAVASPISVLTKINSEQDRQTLISNVPSTTVNYAASICAGILMALNVNRQLDGSSAGTEVLLIADGEDLFLPRCYNDISDSGALIHVIALSSNAAKELEHIADMTGGQKHFAADRADANDFIDAFNAVTNGDGDVTQQLVMLESVAVFLESGECLNNTVFIDGTVGTSTSFLVTWQAAVPEINLLDPMGNNYTENQFINSTTAKSSRLQIPGKAESGSWHYTVCNDLTTAQAVGVIVTSKASDTNVPPVTVTVQMSRDTNTYPDPMIIYASVRQGLKPVTGVQVTATIQFESGNSTSVELLDNGAGADTFKHDGVYSKYFTDFRENGRHYLKVLIKGGNTDNAVADTRNHAFYVPGYLENGTIFLNAPRPTPTNDSLETVVDQISRVASGGTFIVNGVPTGPQNATYQPGKITDLEAKAQGNVIILTWTATGDDLDKGRASRYELRWSTSPRDLRDNFNNANQEDISSIVPQVSGSAETYAFIPRDVDMDGRYVLYIALVAVDQDGLSSDISNIAQASIFMTVATQSSTDVWATPSGSSVSMTSFTTLTDSPDTTTENLPSTSDGTDIPDTTMVDLPSISDSTHTQDTTMVDLPSISDSTHTQDTTMVDLPSISDSTHTQDTTMVDLPSISDSTHTQDTTMVDLPSTSDRTDTSDTTIVHLPSTSDSTPYTTTVKIPSTANTGDSSQTQTNVTPHHTDSSSPLIDTTIPPQNTTPSVNSMSSTESDHYTTSFAIKTSTGSPRPTNKSTTAFTNHSKSADPSTLPTTDNFHYNSTTSKELTTEPNASSASGKINVTIVVVVACAAAVLICIIICVTVCIILCCKRGSYSAPA